MPRGRPGVGVDYSLAFEFVPPIVDEADRPKATRRYERRLRRGGAGNQPVMTSQCQTSGCHHGRRNCMPSDSPPACHHCRGTVTRRKYAPAKAPWKRSQRMPTVQCQRHCRRQPKLRRCRRPARAARRRCAACLIANSVRHATQRRATPAGGQHPARATPTSVARRVRVTCEKTPSEANAPADAAAVVTGGGAAQGRLARGCRPARERSSWRRAKLISRAAVESCEVLADGDQAFGGAFKTKTSSATTRDPE